MNILKITHKHSIPFVFFFLMFNQLFTFSQEKIVVKRFGSNPIIKQDMLLGNDGENINGPSLIKVPDWIKNPLGKYYLYFAHHEGKYIRLAYANKLKGPWKIHENGTLKMEECICNFKSEKLSNRRHIASPDVLIDSLKKEIVMYFHCPVYTGGADSAKNYPQVTLRATSKNGIDFKPEKEILGASYFRVFKWDNQHYAISVQGKLYKSKDGISNFIEGHNPFKSDENSTKIRHSAVLVRNKTLYVFYSRIGDKPERILLSKIKLTQDWTSWNATKPETILEPELDYEGINEPLETSLRGASKKAVRELRDPCIFQEKKKTYLLYSVAGELGIGIAELQFLKK
jgi:hypothetical protein